MCQIHNSPVCVSRVPSNRNPLAGEVALFHCVRTTQNKAPFFRNFCSSRPSSTFESSLPHCSSGHQLFISAFMIGHLRRYLPHPIPAPAIPSFGQRYPSPPKPVQPPPPGTAAALTDRHHRLPIRHRHVRRRLRRPLRRLRQRPQSGSLISLHRSFQRIHLLVCMSQVSSNRNPLTGEVTLFHCACTTTNKIPFFCNVCSSHPSSQ